MTKREAKRWACGMAASLIETDIEAGGVFSDDDPDHKKRLEAIKELVRELKRRGEAT